MTCQLMVGEYGPKLTMRATLSGHFKLVSIAVAARCRAEGPGYRAEWHCRIAGLGATVGRRGPPFG